MVYGSTSSGTANRGMCSYRGLTDETESVHGRQVIAMIMRSETVRNRGSVQIRGQPSAEGYI